MSSEEAAELVDVAFYEALLDDDPVELYERAPCAYLSTRPDGTVVKVNATFLTWTGFERAAVLGRRLSELLPAGGRIYYETHVGPMLAMQGMVREIATEVVCADGSRLPVILNAVLEREETGDPRIIRVALFDATERRAYEHELLRARQQAEEAEQRARQLAETLQASLLPPHLLVIPDLDVAGAYRPAGDGYEVGGDFYDVFETGRETWGIVLGDVCGKGAAAATVTSLARYAVRAAALRLAEPSAVLATLHDAMLRSHVDRFLTALFLVLARTPTGAFQLTVASGGHHLPMLLRDGAVQRVGQSGTFLGMLERARFADVTVELVPGDALVLYTDGVTEARRGDEFLDDGGLIDLLLDAPPAMGAQDLADHVVQRALDFQDGLPRDDIAVVVLRVPARA
jgi:sigma-B regulation protein RsbU (phosphoserine phosphatase)